MSTRSAYARRAANARHGQGQHWLSPYDEHRMRKEYQKKRREKKEDGQARKTEQAATVAKLHPQAHTQTTSFSPGFIMTTVGNALFWWPVAASIAIH